MAAVDTSTLLDRFLRYVRIDTQSDERSATYPSTPGQLELSRLLRNELAEFGLADARMTEHGIVHATVPGNIVGAPTLAFIAHVDTSPETTGKNVNPQVIRNYRGGDISLPGDRTKVIRVADNPQLNSLHGKTLITTDGTTLLGADDKAGVAVIMEAAKVLRENPSIPHGPVKVCFTCDEEIGKGVLYLSPLDLNAQAAYTLDGAGVHARHVGNRALRRVLHRHAPQAADEIAQPRLELLTSGVARRSARQVRERMRFDGVHQRPWRALGGDEVVPAPGGEVSPLPEDARHLRRDGIEAPEVVEQPAVQAVVPQRGLDRWHVER